MLDDFGAMSIFARKNVGYGREKETREVMVVTGDFLPNVEAEL